MYRLWHCHRVVVVVTIDAAHRLHLHCGGGPIDTGVICQNT